MQFGDRDSSYLGWIRVLLPALRRAFLGDEIRTIAISILENTLAKVPIAPHGVVQLTNSEKACLYAAISSGVGCGYGKGISGQYETL